MSIAERIMDYIAVRPGVGIGHLANALGIPRAQIRNALGTLRAAERVSTETVDGGRVYRVRQRTVIIKPDGPRQWWQV